MRFDFAFGPKVTARDIARSILGTYISPGRHALLFRHLSSSNLQDASLIP